MSDQELIGILRICPDDESAPLSLHCANRLESLIADTTIASGFRLDPVSWLREQADDMDCCCQASVLKLADALQAAIDAVKGAK